jgi:hypothetical protein
VDEVQAAQAPPRTRSGVSKLLGTGLGAVTLTAGALTFFVAYKIVSHRGPMVQAAKLGALERHDTAWIFTLMAALALAFAIALAAFGYGYRQAVSRTWRWRLTAGALVLALAPGLAYGLGVGWRAEYVNGHERGVVTRQGVVRSAWTDVSSTEIGCALDVGSGKHPDHALITFKVAFPDGQADDFSFQVRRGVTGEMLDWDLWIAYQIRKAYWDDPSRPKPVITPNPQCAWYFTIAASPEVKAKLGDLFAPVTSHRTAR